MGRLFLIVILGAVVLLSGCTEEEQAAQRELWLGEPNPYNVNSPAYKMRNPSIFAIREDDTPATKEFISYAKKQYIEGFDSLSTMRAREAYFETAVPRADKEIKIMRMQEKGLINEKEAAIMSYNADIDAETSMRMSQLNRQIQQLENNQQRIVSNQREIITQQQSHYY